MEPGTRLRAARGIGKSETEASIEVFQTLKRRGHPDAPPPTVSDGCGGIREAMVEVYGKVPEYAGIGRPPTKKRPEDGWQYLQVVKQREKGRVVGIRLRVVYGDKEDVLRLLAHNGLCRAHASHVAPFQQPPDAEDAGLLQGPRDAPIRCCLGRHRLQPGPPAQDLAP